MISWLAVGDRVRVEGPLGGQAPFRGGEGLVQARALHVPGEPRLRIAALSGAEAEEEEVPFVPGLEGE